MGRGGVAGTKPASGGVKDGEHNGGTDTRAEGTLLRALAALETLMEAHEWPTLLG